jgi:hypothetical protein
MTPRQITQAIITKGFDYVQDKIGMDWNKT